jgi:hypothetical protein
MKLTPFRRKLLLLAAFSAVVVVHTQVNDDCEHATAVSVLPFTDSGSGSTATFKMNEVPEGCYRSRFIPQSRQLWHAVTGENEEDRCFSAIGGEYVAAYSDTRALGTCEELTCSSETIPDDEGLHWRALRSSNYKLMLTLPEDTADFEVVIVSMTAQRVSVWKKNRNLHFLCWKTCCSC